MEYDIQIEFEGAYTGFRGKSLNGRLFLSYMYLSPELECVTIEGDEFVWVDGEDGREIINRGTNCGIRFGLEN